MSVRAIIVKSTKVAAQAISRGTPGAKGDPGGNAMAIGLFTAASALLIPVGTDIVQTSGYSTTGEAHARYAYDSSVNSAYVSAHPRSSFVSSNGRGFKLAETFITPEQLGSKGDGTTDDYAAWQELAAYVNAKGGGVIVLGKGKTYRWNQHVTASNGITDIKFSACNGLVIEGNGAKIDVQGSFDRDASTTRELTFQFDGCSNINLRNYEVDGNVDLMTNSSGSSEGFCYGALFTGCIGVTIDQVYIHHYSTDGFSFQAGTAVSGVRPACRDVTMLNCRSEYNGRLGVSLIQVRGFLALNSRFSYTGQFTGTYGVGGVNGHAPRKGLDIEPLYGTTTASPNTMDVNTGDIVFGGGCRFIQNKSGNWSAALPAVIDTITFRDCDVDDTNSDGSFSYVLNVPNVTVENCRMFMADSVGNFCHSNDPTVNGRFVGNKVSGSNCMIQSAISGSGRVFVAQNDFVCTATATYTHALMPIALANPNIVYENNRLYVPKEAWGSGGAGDSKQMATVAGVSRSMFNRFETNLTATYSGATSAHFHTNNYGSNTEVIEDRYVGTATGAADTFRPSNQVTFDTTYRFTRGHPGYAGVPGTATLTDADYTHTHTINPGVAKLNAALTAARLITLSTTNATAGAELRVVRTANSTGAFNLNVNNLKNLTTGQWCTVRYDGSAWVLVAFGSL